MSEGKAKEPQKPLARSHDQYGQFTVISIIVPLIGLILGIAYLARKDPVDRKLGEHAIALSLLFGIIWSVVLTSFNPFRVLVGVPAVSTSPVTTVTATPPVATNPQATVGSALTLDSAQVTIQKVIDPITSQYKADVGNRYIGVQLQITNEGTNTLTGDVNNNVTVIRSDNQSATVGFTTSSVCTNFTSGMYTISPGSSATGCVFFRIPDGMTASKIQYNSNAGFGGQTGEWTVQ